MYNCPNCGGHIRYDIPTGKIHCDSCDSSFDPYAIGEGKDAEEQKTYETTVFTCPHCGGEITSTDVTAASFCTYCGSPVILDSRISRARRPALILPFTRTKADCKNAYRRLMQKAVFVPKELRDPEYLEQFRGIYIPYWLFDVQFHGISSIRGSKTRRQGDYLLTTDYELRGDLDATYPNIYYDASSSFDDNIGETIAPYESAKMQAFTPSFLCGFYADTTDVGSSVYRNDAKAFATQEVALALSEQPSYRNFAPDPGQNFHLGAEMAKARLAMFPVWFLTWRKGSRVAYAVANGQTGKISADLPIDYGKYILGSVLAAVPIFLILNLFFTLAPINTLFLTSILALAALVLYSRQLEAIRVRKERSDDKGYQTMQKKLREKERQEKELHEKELYEKDLYEKDLTGNEDAEVSGTPSGRYRKPFTPLKDLLHPDSGTGREKKKSSPVPAVGLCILLAALLLNSDSGSRTLLLILLAVISLIALYTAGAILQRYPAKELVSAAGTVMAPIIALAIVVIYPVSDMWYYLGALVSLLGISLGIIGILRKYNDQAMRPLPDFVHREGGDNRA